MPRAVCSHIERCVLHTPKISCFWNWEALAGLLVHGSRIDSRRQLFQETLMIIRNAALTLSFAALSLYSALAVAQEGTGTRGPSAEIALSNDTLEVRYLGSGAAVGMDRSSRLSGGFFLSEERDIVLDVGVNFPAIDAGRLTIAVGPQIYAALLDEENNDVFSVTVGAQVRFLLQPEWGLAIAGKAYFGPDILTFGTADTLTDLSARLEMEFSERVLGFAGMRWFEFDLIDGAGEQTLMEEVFVGAAYRF
jgi:hypothetical protein